MIHDAQAEITCDFKGCESSEYVTLEYVYGSRSPGSGYYDSRDASIEKSLIDEHDWAVSDGKHYCDWHEDEKEA